MKKPVVSSDLPPLNELVIIEKNGFLVPAYDHEHRAAALAMLLHDRRLCQKMEQAQYEFCVTYFTIEQHRGSIERIYNSLKRYVNIRTNYAAPLVWIEGGISLDGAS